jgi:hypothetical protein
LELVVWVRQDWRRPGFKRFGWEHGKANSPRKFSNQRCEIGSSEDCLAKNTLTPIAVCEVVELIIPHVFVSDDVEEQLHAAVQEGNRTELRCFANSTEHAQVAN